MAGGGTLRVYYDLPCGSVYQTISVSAFCSGGPFMGGSFSYYPNPVNTELTVCYDPMSALSNDNSEQVLPNPNPLFEAELYNNKGNRVRKLKNISGTNELLIHTGDLPNGTYILHIIGGKKPIKKQIIIEH